MSTIRNRRRTEEPADGGLLEDYEAVVILCLWVLEALTDEDVARLSNLSKRTIGRLRNGQFSERVHKLTLLKLGFAAGLFLTITEKKVQITPIA